METDAELSRWKFPEQANCWLAVQPLMSPILPRCPEILMRPQRERPPGAGWDRHSFKRCWFFLVSRAPLVTWILLVRLVMASY